jgi:hypothetical protein
MPCVECLMEEKSCVSEGSQRNLDSAGEDQQQFTRNELLCDCEAVAYLRFHHLGSSLWNQVTITTPS